MAGKKRYRPKRTEAERAKAQWYGVWEPQDVSSFSRDMAKVVEKTVAGLGLEQAFDEEEIFAAWNKLVEPFIAQNSRPIGLTKGVMQIQVLHSSVFYELERMKGTILQRMQQEFGADKVKTIQFRLG